MKIKLVMLISIIITLSIIVPSMASNDKIPFCPGEKMTFQVRWAFVIAGEATLEFLPHEQFDGIESCHFLFTAKTSKFVDLFYKVRDRIESYTDKNITRSLFYKKRHEGKSKKEITVTFDWNGNRTETVTPAAELSRETGVTFDQNENHAQYSDGINARKPLPIMPNTFDPLSVFYAFRLYLKEDNNDSDINVTDGKKCIVGRAKIIKREKIRVAGNEYNTLLVEPEMENIGGVFEKSKNARLKIWVTDDELRIPVRIKSKVTVGSFVADLVSYQKGLKTANSH